jgi:hypothetical protein
VRCGPKTALSERPRACFPLELPRERARKLPRLQVEQSTHDCKGMTIDALEFLVEGMFLTFIKNSSHEVTMPEPEP